jgi:uroporphyrinogen decarboxylase
MQPIRRFGFDAAILFSDILVVPHALGRKLRFEEGRGPIMEPLEAGDVSGLREERFHDRLAPVYETVRRLKGELPRETALIGFCGAPWTVATYMIAGAATPDQGPARMFGYLHPRAMDSLLDLLADLSADYLIRQVDAGAEVVQIFDSWAGVLDEGCFDRYALRPVARLVKRFRRKHAGVPVIGFPKGAGHQYEGYRAATGVTAVGLDWTVPLKEAKRLQESGPVQGNLDPLRLAAGGAPLDEAVLAILAELGDGPLIFNLGHGIVPHTPPGHVARLLELVRGASR